MERFVKYYDLSGHWLFEKPQYAMWWMDLIFLACWEKKKFFVNGAMIECDRGQLAWSQIKLSERWKCSRQNVRTFLNNLEKDSMIVQDFSQKSNHKNMIITICNYSEYQDIQPQKQPLANHRLTTSQPQTNPIQEIPEYIEDTELKDIRANALVNKPKKQPKEFNGKDCEAIFLHWQSVMGHPQSQLLEKRKKLIQKTLDSGYTPIQAKLAIDGHKNSKWHKDNGFDGIEYSLKPENIDKFIKMAGMTDAELNRTSGTINWNDTTWADGLQAEYGVRDRDISKATKN